MQHVARGCNPTKQGVSTTHSKKRPNQNDGGADNRKKSIVKPSKKKSIVSKSRRKFTVDEKVAMVKEIEADIAREEDVIDSSKKSKEEICKKHDLHITLFYAWQKACCICMNKIVNYTTGGVRCPVEKCSTKICYECLARAFLEQLVNANRFDYIDVSTARCVHCRVYSLVVRNSGSDGLVADINCEPFSKFLLKHIKKDINNCQQLLGPVCMELAHHRQALNAIYVAYLQNY